MKTLLLVLGSILICISCQNKSKQADTTMATIFSETELNDLKTMQSFFEAQLAENLDMNGKKNTEVWQKFFDSLDTITKIASLKVPVDFEQQKAMYQQTNNETFDQIWKIEQAVRYPVQDTVETLRLNRDGKYVMFLNSLAKKYPVVQKYAESLDIAGDLSPSMVSSVIKEYAEFDISDPDIRLLLAVHFLSLNDSMCRNTKNHEK